MSLDVLIDETARKKNRPQFWHKCKIKFQKCKIIAKNQKNWRYILAAFDFN